MKTFLLAAALILTSATALHAQLDDTDPQYRAVCRQALAKPFTPPPADPAFSPACDSTTFYFGIGHPVDYAAARSCAFTEYAQPTASFNPFPGAGILSMIYANGQAPAPNPQHDLDLAIRFTCENWAAPAEIEARLDILLAEKEEQAHGSHTLQPFDLCDTAFSANSLGWCTSIEARQSEIERNQGIAQVRASLPPAALPAFEALQSAEQDFEDARTHNEIDLSGAMPAFEGFHLAEKVFAAVHAAPASTKPASSTPASSTPASSTPASSTPPAPSDPVDPIAANPVRIAEQLEEQNDLGDHFLDDLRLITSPGFAEKTSLSKADKNLAVAFKLARIAAPKRFKNTNLTVKGIDETQGAWLDLRDAWIAFARALNPAISDQVSAYITAERTRQLNELVGTAHERAIAD